MKIKNITFSYNQKKDILKSVNAHINEGEITTIIGPNGSGKSTLLGVISDHYQPQTGQVLLKGKELQTYKPKELARVIAVVHQQNRAPDDMTVEKLVSYGRIPYQSLFKQTLVKENEEAIEWALEATNLIDKRNFPISELSGGEKQRVWIALSLAQRTPYLFLDEPTTYLDIYFQYEVLEFIKKLNKDYGLTIVMVLHDINQAIQYSDSIIAMKNGQVVNSGKADEIITKELIHDVFKIHVEMKKENETGLYMVPIGI